MNVLFVDERNAGASQLAQAWAEHAGLAARSAGLHPAIRLDGDVREILDSQRLGAAEREPRALTSMDVGWADVVVAIDCDSQQAGLPGRLLVEWHLAEAAASGAQELSTQLRRLVVELVMEVAGLPIRDVDSVPPVTAAGRPVR